MSTTGAHLLALPIVFPLIGAFLMPLVARIGDGPARFLGLVAALANIALGVLIWTSAGDGAAVSALSGIKAPHGIVLYGDQMAALFVTVLAVAILVFWPKPGDGGTRAYTLMLLLLAGGSGLMLSGDLFNIFVFYEITAVASYGLTASGGNKTGFAAAIRFLLIGALGSALMLLGIALVYAAAGTLNLADLAQLAPEKLTGATGLTAFALLVIGFGVKAEFFPVNTWVPEVYAAAPARVTAILAGVVSKLAIIVILRLLVLVFHDPAASTLLMIIGILGIIGGELAAYRSRDLNRMLAFSSIAQLGIIAVALAIPGEAGVFAALAVALHHALVKPAFFIIASQWRGSLAGLAGAAKAAPVAGALFVLLSLSIIGIPPLPGFWVKLAVLQGAFAAGGGLVFAAAVILAAAIIEAGYLFRVIEILWRPSRDAGPSRVALAELRPAMLLGAALILATFFIAPLGEALTATAVRAADGPSYIARVLPGSVQDE